MATQKPPRRRCAIYTRKSSEEGLDQDFNSLDAQREACEAYVQSQIGEGWKLLRARYDDGGFSGGNVNRPGLQQLLVDIEAGKVDTVVVYKVDRLTRSLPDFAKIVDVLDAQKVSFVSVTQQFNTTTSMGRLTLNMLLSFAQFEREVTGERIRDKIAASKKKGLWMGGLVPLGYEADGRTLKIVPEEAETVRTIFELYREHRSSWKVKREADRLGLRTKLRTFKDGRTSGGLPFRLGHIHRIVHNPLYIGQIQHKGVVHEGQHDAIIDLEMWDATRFGRSTESESRRAPKSKKKQPIPYPLRGKLYDEAGVALRGDSSRKGGRRYRYYQSAKTAADEQPADAAKPRPTWRIAAQEIEGLIERGIQQLLDDPAKLAHAAIESGIPESDVPRLIEQSDRAAAKPTDLLERAQLHPSRVAVWLEPSRIVDGVMGCIRHDLPMQIRRRGVETRLILPSSNAQTIERPADAALLKVFARARFWFKELAEGRASTLDELGRREGVNARYLGAVMPLAFVSPKLTLEILQRRYPIDLTADSLVKQADIPLEWQAQGASIGLTEDSSTERSSPN